MLWSILKSYIAQILLKWQKTVKLHGGNVERFLSVISKEKYFCLASEMW